MSDRGFLISGGTGLIGSRLAEALRLRGRPLRLLTRRPASLAAAAPDRAIGWDGVSVPREAVQGCDAIVHLAGEPVFGGIPSAARRERMVTSRVASTRSIVDAISGQPPEERPSTFVCASAVGIYGDAGDAVLTEADAGEPSGFLAELCRDWEAAAAEATPLGVRVVSLRIGVVLAKGEGALSMIVPLFKAGLGGRLGSGRQVFPWVHADDVVRLILHALDTPELAGPVNAVAPGAVTNAEFTTALGRALGRPTILPVPGFAIRTALGPLASEFLDSRRVHPAAAERTGFTFSRPTLEAAFEDFGA